MKRSRVEIIVVVWEKSKIREKLSKESSVGGLGSKLGMTEQNHRFLILRMIVASQYCSLSLFPICKFVIDLSMFHFSGLLCSLHITSWCSVGL